MSQLLGGLIEPASQDGEGERPFDGDESAADEEAGLVAGEFGRTAGDNLLDDRPHGEVGSARFQAVAEEGSGLLEDDLVHGLDVLQFRLLAFGLVEFFDQPEAIQLREVRLPARALDDAQRSA